MKAAVGAKQLPSARRISSPLMKMALRPQPGQDGLTDDAFVKNLLVDLCAEAGVAITPLPPTLRLRRRGDLTFAFNLAETHAHAPAPIGAVFVIGGAEIEPFGVAVWR
jgi:hypothetical protein